MVHECYAYALADKRVEEIFVNEIASKDKSGLGIGTVMHLLYRILNNG